MMIVNKHQTTKKNDVAKVLPYSAPAIFSGDGEIGPFTLQGVFDVILTVARNVVSYVGLIAVVMIVIAGILLMTNGSDDGSRDRAKRIVLYTVIGIIVILLASAIVNTVITALGS